MIPYGHQDISKTDIDAVVEVLRSEFLTQGPAVPRFEKGIRELTGAAYALAVNSATSALHIACLALDVSPGDIVWTVANTFVASANCALYCGAKIDFVDIDLQTYNICPKKLEEKLLSAQRSGTLPKVLIPVHFAGRPAPQQEIWQLAQKYGVRIIEDASHAIGAVRHQEAVGSCRWSDITVFSFHPVKIITTGEGGMALTNDTQLAEKMDRIRCHGIEKTAALEKSKGAWYYQQVALGYNYRMSDIHAALGCSQLGRLARYIEKRNQLAQKYTKAFAGCSLQCPGFPEDGISSWHLYVIQLAEAGKRRAIFTHLRTMGIGVHVHYIPVYHQPWFQQMGFQKGYCPAAETYYSRALTLPLFPA